MNERFFDETFLRRLERLALVARQASAGQTQGERRSPKRGQSVEFSDFRPYVAGDDFRRIDWNAYARLERFFIKLFVEEEDLPVHILIDTSRSMDWGEPYKLWYASRVAGALGYIALAGLDRVTVTAVGGSAASTFPPHRGKHQALALFDFLESLNKIKQTEPTSMGGSIWIRQSAAGYANSRSASGISKRGALILLSDLMNDGWTEGLRALASRGFEVSVLQILAPDEVEPDMSGDLKLIDSEDTSAVEITADYDLLARYKQGLAEWQGNLRRFCSARSMLYIPITTAMPLEDLLFAWLERQGVLR